MKRNRFFGIYYKHQSIDGYTLAVIDSFSNEGKMIQVITNDKTYLVKDTTQVHISNQGIYFNINQEDLKINGTIEYKGLHKPNKDIMSYFRYLPIECKHNIYSMHHKINGTLNINNQIISFDNGDGYMEGDEGRNFPKKYLWFNASKEDTSITLAIADIPLGIFHILGNTCLIKTKDKEYRFGTYNFTKVTKLTRNHISLKKGPYTLEIQLLDNSSFHPLKAPQKGDMVRYIHECPSIEARYILKRKSDIIIDITHPYASFEYVFKD